MYVLNLVVIRVVDLERSRNFYSGLGLTFTLEKHGAGPEHLTARTGGAVFELYPSGRSGETIGVRLGFTVGSLKLAIEKVELAGGKVLALTDIKPGPSSAVLQDPDGHKVEIVEEDDK